MKTLRPLHWILAISAIIPLLIACRDMGSTTSAVFEQNRKIYHYAVTDVQVRFSKDSIPIEGDFSLNDPKSATLLALWEITSLKPDQPRVNSSGISIDSASLTPEGSGKYLLKYSARFSIIDLPPSEFPKYHYLGEISDQSARKIFQEAPTCFRYHLMEEFSLGADDPINVQAFVNKIRSTALRYVYAGYCKDNHLDNFKKAFTTSDVAFIRSEGSNSSVSPDLRKLTSDGNLNFYFLFVNDKFILDESESRQGYDSESPSNARSENGATHAADSSEDGASQPTMYTNPASTQSNYPERNSFELLDIQDTLVKEMVQYFSQRFESSPKILEPGVYEFTSKRIVPGVQTKLIVHQVSRDMHKALEKIKAQISTIDVLTYNGHAGLGNHEIFEFFNSNSSALNDYKVLAMNACWTSTFFMRKVAPGTPQKFDFIGHSETIVFDTFPMINRMLFDTVIEQRTYQDFVDRSTKGVATEKGGSLERTRDSFFKGGGKISELLPGTIVFERSDLQ